MRTRSLLPPRRPAAAVPSRRPAQVPPDKALSTFKVADGLQVELFAAEPMFVNPTCMDIDHKGRVWVCEAVNYRRKLLRPADHPARGRPHRDPRRHRRRRQGRQGDRLLPGAGAATARWASPSPRTRSAPATRSSSASRPTSSSSRTRTATARPTARRRSSSPASAASTTTTASTASSSAPTASSTSPSATRACTDLQIDRRQGPQVDEQRHRLPGRHRLALRPGRHEPRADRPQLPQRVRAVRR